MPTKELAVTYEDLLEASKKNSPIEVVGESVYITINGLKKGAYYMAPFYFWSQKKRPLRVEIMQPGTKTKVLVTKNFSTGRSLDTSGKDQWIEKRYRIDKTRHNGRARLRIGWPAEEKVTASCSFKIIAAPLTSKRMLKEQRRAAGLCPECGKAGVWVRATMLCKKHGIIMGA